MKRQHSRWSPWTVVLAANALVDEETPADRADVHAGIVVGLSADELTGGAGIRHCGLRPPIQCEPVSGLLADLRLRPETHEAGYRMKRAIDVTGRSVDPATVFDIVQTVKALLREKAAS